MPGKKPAKKSKPVADVEPAIDWKARYNAARAEADTLREKLAAVRDLAAHQGRVQYLHLIGELV